MHRHDEWRILKKGTWGMYQKQDVYGKTMRVWLMGRIEKCKGCPLTRLIPVNENLPVVMIEGFLT